MINRQTPEARKESLRKYRQTEKFKACQKRYYATEKGKVCNKKRQAKYHATKKGKETRIKAENKRKRNLGFVKLFPNPFDETIEIQWHHITDNYVIALPKTIHNICGGGKLVPQEKCWPYVEQFYVDSFCIGV